MSTTTAQPDFSKTLDLRKQKVLDLKKSKGIEGQKAQVVLSLDFSGSMDHLYKNGKVQELVERLLPIGMAFDDNGEVDFYLFHHDQIKMKENLTVSNTSGYIDKKIIGKYDMGTTSYAPVIRQIMKDFGNKTGEREEEYEVEETKGGGFLGLGTPKKVMVKKKRKVPIYGKMELPVYVIMIADGGCDDRADTEEAIREASNMGIFFQFVGIGIASFAFLEKLDDLTGRNIDNANFFSVKDLGSRTDDELYQSLMNEFPTYIPEARRKGLIN